MLINNLNTKMIIPNLEYMVYHCHNVSFLGYHVVVMDNLNLNHISNITLCKSKIRHAYRN